jgi:hypothetical protein
MTLGMTPMGEVDPDFCFDVEDLEVSGYFELTGDEAHAVENALYSGLGGPVAAMWWVNGLLPTDIIRSRLVRFPLEVALAAGRLIWSLPENSRWPVVHTVYTLYRFAKQRDDDYRRNRTRDGSRWSPLQVTF